MSCNFPSWNVSAVTCKFKVSLSSAVSWHTMPLRQSVIITPVCLTYLTVYLYWFTLRNRCCNLGLNSARGLMLNCTRGLIVSMDFKWFPEDIMMKVFNTIHQCISLSFYVAGWRLKHNCDTQ